MLIVQGLDYWLWATQNLDQLRRHFDAPAITGITVDYATKAAPTKSGPVATDGPNPALLSSYAPAQLRRIRDVDQPCNGAEGGTKTSPS